jgi:hypothetical protein
MRTIRKRSVSIVCLYIEIFNYNFVDNKTTTAHSVHDLRTFKESDVEYRVLRQAPIAGHGMQMSHRLCEFIGLNIGVAENSLLLDNDTV